MSGTTKPRRTGPARGFTLVELMVVVIIIGILMSLILLAAMDGVRRAEERATQGLITKLETGLNDRLQALLEQLPPYNPTHHFMAAVYNGTSLIPSLQRTSVIAQYDYIKAEVPDVFVFNQSPNNADYPLNFAAQPFPGQALSAYSATHMPYVLPLGHAIYNNPSSGYFGEANPSDNFPDPYGTGIYGASYSAAAGVYKNLGRSIYTDSAGVTTELVYAPAGYDGIDNNQNGLIDEFSEGTSLFASDSNKLTAFKAAIAKHTHKTARSEVLYALLVEGQGPLGSTFDADDFTDREVQDTDGDGLPEFVDAWGEPLQFYRWPIYFHSDLQRGVPVNNTFNAGNSVTAGNGVINFPYTSVFDPREQNTLDPNQQLVAPSWWSSAYNTGTATNPISVTYPFTSAAPISPGAVAFSTYFHPLVEPASSSGAQPQFFWDRGTTYYQRRSFFSKFLIVSSGPDRELGIARLDTVANSSGSAYATPYSVANVLIESQARHTNLVASSIAYQTPSDANPVVITGSGNPLSESFQDDISNQNLQAPGGVTQ